jgi:cell wall-associated NlpC family hydrolase
MYKTFKHFAGLILVLTLVGCVSSPSKTKKTKSSVTILSLQQAEEQLLGYYTLWEGTPYLFGGNSDEGIDCSAFVRNAYKSVFDVEVPRTTIAQAEIGEKIAKADLIPGDLVLFKTSRSTRHVGVVVQGNKFMHVSTKKGVIVSSLDNVYWRKKYWKAVRPDNGLAINS